MKEISTSMGGFDNMLFRIGTRFLPKTKLSAATIHKVPVIINNYNRLDCLRQQIAWLENAGMKNIYIIDNASSYPPLLHFYQTTQYQVFRLDINVGFMALWKTILFQRFSNDYYIYTDPDIIPVEDCPLTVVSFFYELLQKYPAADKVGFGLEINDLPDHYPLKEKVQRWEAQFWKSAVERDVYAAQIDTTFALYRPGVAGGSELNALRTGGAYQARHLSWYVDPENLPEEEMFYMQHASTSSSWVSELLGKDRNIKY